MIAPAIDALQEVVLPRVKLNHLYVVDCLSGDFHPCILAFHNLLLHCAKIPADGKVGEECGNENSDSGKEAIAEEVERDGEGSDEDKWYLHDIADLVADPEESLGIHLYEIDDLPRGEVFVSSWRDARIFFIDEGDD